MKEKREFLIWLSKDDPSVFSCYACAYLHRKVILRSTCLHDLQNAFLFPRRNYTHYSIYFVQIQLAIRAHIISPEFCLSLHGCSLKWLIELSRTSQSRYSHFNLLVTTTTAFPGGPRSTPFKVHSSVELDMTKAKQDKHLRSQAITHLWHRYHDQLGEFMQKLSCAHQVNYVQPVISTLLQMDRQAAAGQPLCFWTSRGLHLPVYILRN